MKAIIERGATSVILHVFVQDSSLTTGAGLAGLVFNSAGLTCARLRGGETLASPTFQDITTLGTYEAPTANTQIRFKQVHATNAPGWYEIHLHNDWLDATNTRRNLVIMLFGAANMAPVNIEVELSGFSLHDVDPDVNVVKVANTVQTARDLGLALPAVAPAANGGLPTVNANNRVKAILERWISDDAPGTPDALDANGGVNSNLQAILGTLLTEAGAGRLTAAFKMLFDVAAPVFTAANVNQSGDAYSVANGRLPAALTAGGNIKADMFGVLGTVLTEDVGGYLAAGFKKLFNVAVALTVADKALLSAQDVRDTMKLAPTVGVPVAGSVDKHLDDIETDTTEIGAAGAGLTALGDARLANLDATVNSRSTYAGGAVASVTGDVGGKVLGGGASALTGTGARVVDAIGNNVAPASDVTTLLSRIVGTLAAGTHNPQSGDAYGVVSNGTYGNSALQVLIDALNDLTAQQIRDAMKLAPTAGAPAAGSVDTHLDDIEADTAQIGLAALQPVGCKTAMAYGRANAIAQRTYRTKHFIPYGATNFRLCYANTYLATGTVAETDTGNAINLKCAIESSDGSIVSATWGGAATKDIPQGEYATSDVIAMTVPVGGYVWVRCCVTVGAGEYYPTSWTTNSNDGEGSCDGDRAAAGEITAGTVAGVYPLVLLGSPLVECPSVAILGDSIGQGARDYSWRSGYPLGGGWFRRTLDGVMPYTQFSQSGDRLYWQQDATKRPITHALLGLYRHAVVACGVNDVYYGYTLANIEAYALALGGIAAAAGCVPHLVTVTPITTSTDAWTTLGNQVLSANEAARLSLNGWARAIPAPFASCIDFAAPVEDASGKWLAPATVLDSGTASGGAANNLTDAAKAWTQNVYYGNSAIRITGGTGVGQVYPCSTAGGNTATVYYVNPSVFSPIPDGTSIYQIEQTLTTDGIHPGAYGHNLMAAVLQPCTRFPALHSALPEQNLLITEKLPSRPYLAGSAAATGEVQTDAAAALTDYDPPTNAEMVARTLAAAAYALATVCTEARLAELDAVNLPATTDAILADTGTDGVVVAAASKTGYALSAAAITAILDSSTAGAATADTVREALQAARAQGMGKWALAGNVLTIYKQDGVTALVAFTLAPAGGPYTSRTPA